MGKIKFESLALGLVFGIAIMWVFGPMIKNSVGMLNPFSGHARYRSGQYPYYGFRALPTRYINY